MVFIKKFENLSKGTFHIFHVHLYQFKCQERKVLFYIELVACCLGEVTLIKLNKMNSCLIL